MKKSKALLQYIVGLIFGASLLSLIMAIGGVEYDNITLGTGAIWGAISLAVMGLCIIPIRRLD